MHKRKVLIVSLAVLLVIGLGVYVVSRPATSTPQRWAKAKAMKPTVACLQLNDKLTVPASTRNDIEMAAMSYLIDVPAGTNVDVKLATYTPTSVTGADYYPEKYGKYNFTLTKDDEGWRVTKFKPCY